MDDFYSPCSWGEYYESNTRAICGLDTSAAEVPGNDKGGVFALKARYCDIYQLTTKTMDPPTMKLLDYQIDQGKINDQKATNNKDMYDRGKLWGSWSDTSSKDFYGGETIVIKDDNTWNYG